MADLAAPERSPTPTPGVRAGRSSQWPSWLPLWLPGLALLLAVTLPHIGQGDFRTDTAWYSAIGVQAWRADSWAFWWTPQAEPGHAYFNKPPLALWIHGLLLHVLGVKLWAARIGSVLAAAIAVALAVRLARLGYSRLGAATAGCVLALTYEFFRRTKEVSLDLWHAAFLTAALACLAAAVLRAAGLARDDQPRPEGQSVPRGLALWSGWAAWAVGSGACVGLALMCKPLQASLALPIVLVWGLAVVPSKARGRVLLGVTLAGVAAIAVAAPWHLLMTLLHGDMFTDRYFGGEIAERLKGAGNLAQFDVEPQHWSFYFKQLGATYWPWLAMAVAAVWLTLRERRTAGQPRATTASDRSPTARHAILLLAVLWALVWLIALTVFPDRRDRYALVLWPALAVVAAALIETRWFALDRGGRTREGLARLVRSAPALAMVGGIVFALIPVRIQRGIDPQWPALFEFLGSEELRGQTIYAGGIDGNMSARLYLELGWWPRVVYNPEKLPAGTLLLYHRRGDRSPGTEPSETTVFRNRDVWMTRLDAPPWSPRNPGEGWE